MKKLFEDPELAKFAFDVKDIIVTSGPKEDDEEGEEEQGG